MFYTFYMIREYIAITTQHKTRGNYDFRAFT